MVGIIHTVGIINFSPDPNEVVPPTVAIATGVLEAALSFPSIRRVVFTSSSVAIAFPNPNVVFPVNSSVFNDAAVEAAWAPPPYNQDRAFATYAASKVEAERAIAKFVAEKHPTYKVNLVLPNTTLGEILQPEHQDGSTSGLVTGLYKGEENLWTQLIGPQWFVDVKDIARLHVAALLVPGVDGERLLGYATPFNKTAVLQALRKLEPGKTFANDPEGEGTDISQVDNKRSEELIRKVKSGQGWTGLEESVKEVLKSLRDK